MAIVADLIASAGTVREHGQRADAVELPPKKVYAISGAGFIDIDVDAEIFLFHNLSTSQLVHIRLNTDSDNTAAAAGEPQSIRVDVGETFAFGLPVDTNSSGYKLSVV